MNGDPCAKDVWWSGHHRFFGGFDSCRLSPF